MEIKGNEKYIFAALALVMVMSIALTFFMNRRFIQVQLKDNLVQEIEYKKEIYADELSDLMMEDATYNVTSFFKDIRRADNIHVQVYDEYGQGIVSNSSISDEGLNPVVSMMLNGLVDTIYEENTFYSFTTVASSQQRWFLMLEMSDQRYREGMRNYVYRTVITLLIVSVTVLLLGFKLMDRLKRTETAKGLEQSDENNQYTKKIIREKDRK